MSVEEISSLAEGGVFPVWFLIGAAWVFFMQGGFAMVETGLTRAKNAGNIIMKNLMDFCLGTVAFIFLGFSLMCAEDYVAGVIGVPNLDIFRNFTDYANSSSFVFNLVFCATAATIVSGSMAERTKFSAYCIYSFVISLLIYPIEAGWVWNPNGWLASRGYIDFAGSSAIHMVGGITAFIGAAILGPRIGKYAVDRKTGKKVAKAIPGHNITLAALGCFILWFGWYGFNGAAATNKDMLAVIFINTTLAPAFATCTAMSVTWFKNGKPDVSMSLNGSLAGLVSITAPCVAVDPLGAIIIGIVAGFLVVFAVEIIDQKIKVDDPVGAVSVHGVCGVWGTISAGLFATEGGLFYGGGAAQLGLQLLGVLAIGTWTIITTFILFKVIKATHGLRVTAEEEIQGLDLPEHGLPSSYSGFLFAPEAIQESVVMEDNFPAPAPVKKETVEVVHKPGLATSDGIKFTKVDIITRPSRLEDLKVALNVIGITGMTVSNVMGYGMQKGNQAHYRGIEVDVTFLPKIKLEIVVAKVPVESVIETAKKVLYSGSIGDGKIFVYDVENIIKVRTGEEGYDALQGVE
ncbi:MAG: ammonium transporter [Hungatella sp.]|nr:ammonium transporter [Hungatella sp.]